MKLERKTFDVEIKAVGPATGPEAGTFTAIVSAFDNVDLGGDRVLKGAFTETLAAWESKGDPLPVIWSHQWENPEAHIGYVTAAAETDAGLEIKAKLDVERPYAAQVHHLLVNRRVTQFSFGYFAKDTQLVEDPELGTVREIKSLDVFEVGPTLVGMNPATQLLEAASALQLDAKAGRVLSSKNEQKLRSAYETIGEVLATVAEEPKSSRPSRKAAASDVEVGTFVEWDSAGGTSRGRVEEIVTTGTYEVPETDFTIEASADDPALAIRVYRSVRDGFVATNTIVGHKTSTVRVIEDLPAPTGGKTADLEETVDEAVEESSSSDVDPELVAAVVELLTRPRGPESSSS